MRTGKRVYCKKYGENRLLTGPDRLSVYEAIYRWAKKGWVPRDGAGLSAVVRDADGCICWLKKNA